MNNMEIIKDRVGIVVIGRNEGVRLAQCLKSIDGQVNSVVYVDSGSTDNSVDIAKGMGVDVVKLDPSVPLTAGRGRNQGLKRLITIAKKIEYVQFIDGDCQLVDRWLARAVELLDEDTQVGVVCGRRSELHRHASIYNRLCDMEWDTPVGRAMACGGDAMYRVEAIGKAGGFRESLICGEEPELCGRIRAAGWDVWRIDAGMSLHDAAMTRFGQWFKRMMRSGWAYAEGITFHQGKSKRVCIVKSISIWWWSVVLMLLAVGLAEVTAGWSLCLLAGYVVLVVKTFVQRLIVSGDRYSDLWLYSIFCWIGKWPCMAGQLWYWVSRLRGREPEIIEYKLSSAECN